MDKALTEHGMSMDSIIFLYRNSISNFCV